ncbi:MAG: GHKL domain-containing protein [Lachnospiraceae bacterium]|nr:GHKL domain-containing protein [Lachnospiraceae bacterium]
MTLDVAGLVEHVMKAWLLLYLCQDSIALREKYHSIGKILFFLQTFLVGCWISESVWVNRILYGNEEGMVRDSSYSIVKLAVLMCCSFLAMDLFYRGRKLAKLYLLLVFYAVYEMSRMTLHSVWSVTTLSLLDHLYELIMVEVLDPERFVTIAVYLQNYSMWFFVAGYLALMYVMLKAYRRYLTDMTEHVRELEQLYDGIRGMRHDVNNYVADMEQLLCTSAGEGQLPEQVRQEAAGYLRHMQQAAARLSLQFATGNPVTDVILNRKGQICEQEHIALEGELLYPASLGIEAFDLGILLNNALDNAIEACRKIPAGGERLIRFRGYAKGRMFFVVVENSYDGHILPAGMDRLQTTKADAQSHGLGMSNMRSCVEKYYGTMQYEAGSGRFVLTIMLQGAERA